MRWLAGQMRAHGVDLRLGMRVHRLRAHRPTAGRWTASARTRYPRRRRRRALARRRGIAAWAKCATSSTASNTNFPAPASPSPTRCTASSASATRPATSAGWRRVPPACRPAWRCATIRRNARVPDIDGFLLRVGVAGGLPRHLKPGPTRAGLIPCSGPVFDMARDGAILTGDAAGIVSPVTAGGIHSAWEHGWTVGRAIAAHLRDGGPAPGTGRHRRRAALPHQARAALGLRPPAVRLALRPAAAFAAAALGGRAGVFPQAQVIGRSTASPATLPEKVFPRLPARSPARDRS